jgi:hypothetical protein
MGCWPNNVMGAARGKEISPQEHFIPLHEL